MARKLWILILLGGLMVSPGNLRAELFVSKNHDFTLAPSDEWMQLSLDFQNVVVSYGKKGSLATFHISVRDLEPEKTIQNLKWEDLFSPQFESIDIHQQGETIVGGEKARYCVYTLKPGDFKTKMEGKLPGKYMNTILIHDGKLFSITFKDMQETFGGNYLAFMKVLRTFAFKNSEPSIPPKAS